MKINKKKYKEYKDSFIKALKIENLKLTPQRSAIFKDAVFLKDDIEQKDRWWHA